jgi:hypothetical protein
MLVPDADRRSVARMSEPKINFTDADLELLLVESDRDNPILAAPAAPEGEPRETIDSQILAGLVSP